MDVLNFPLVAIGAALTILVFAFGTRRLLGPRLAPLRTLLAGLIAFFVAQPIISAIGGPSVRRRRSRRCSARWPPWKAR